MAKIDNPYKCDECGVQKQPSNGWLLGLLDNGCVMLSKWSDEMAESKGVAHLCGITCSLAFAGKELANFYKPESL